LVIASVAVELVMLTLLVANSVSETQRSLLESTRLRLKEVEHLLNTALAAPLVQRDYATLQEIMDKSRRDEGIVYLALFDDVNRLMVVSGWDRERPLPDAETDILQDHDPTPDRYDSRLPIQIAGQVYGNLRYGVSTEFLTRAKAELLNESLLIASVEVVLSFALLALVGYLLTRHLAELTQATRQMAKGNVDVLLPVKSRDEVGELTQTFNTMAQSIRARFAELTASEAKFHAIADFTYDWESWYGADQRLIWVNPSVERMTGYAVAECMAMEDFPLPIVHADDRDNARRDYTFTLRGSVGTAKFRIRRKDGGEFWALAGWQPIYDSQGQYQGIRSSIRDITDQQNAEFALQNTISELKASEEQQRRLLLHSQHEQARMTSLLAAMRLGILFETADNRVAYYNPAFLHIWMIDESVELSGQSTQDVLDHSANLLARPDHFSKYILQVPGTHEVSETFEVMMTDGRVITQLCYPVRDPDGRFLGRLWIYEDVTRERQTAEQLIYLAERDSLTGLYNRRRFQEELGRALDTAARRKTHGALLFFDLDEFKYINDTFGHRAGDSMLIRVAREVGALTRHTELLSRLGGDEFAVLMPDASPKDAEHLAERIIRAISQIPFRFEGRNLRLTTSVGIALYPEHATEHEELIAHADAAMYQAKEAGKNAWRVYRHELDTSREMVDRLSWNNRIAQALEKGMLRLHYQGVYDAQTGRLAHIEALVRMVDEEHPGTLIMPGRFIAFAEKTGQIIEVDRWVIRSCLRMLAEDHDFPPVPISVNISGRSFDDPSLPQFIAGELQQHNVRPGQLVVELTETAAISDLHDAQRFIESLQQTGCRVCLDDFGAGFSSFTYLKHLKADILKIDGQFIRDLPNDYDNQIFVKAIVDVARGLRKRTVAEFVEDGETLAMLRAFGVDMVQGYYLNMPGADPPRLSA
jgi:diguanylate cyclase (GGDEF)-like protein/PAS domain S-box-containing protein